MPSLTADHKDMSVDVYQIGYNRDVNKSPLNGAFRSYDCTALPAYRTSAKYFTCTRFHAEGRHLGSDFQRPGVSQVQRENQGCGQTIYRIYRARNPGYDVYFINPFPHLAYLSYNVWEQGEVLAP